MSITMSEKEFYTFCLVQSVPLRLQKGRIYRCQYTLPGTPTVEIPNPDPVTRTSYMYAHRDVEFTVQDLENYMISMTYDDCGFTYARMTRLGMGSKNVIFADDPARLPDDASVVDMNSLDDLVKASVWDWYTILPWWSIGEAVEAWKSIGSKLNYPAMDSSQTDAASDYIDEYNTAFSALEETTATARVALEDELETKMRLLLDL